MQRNRQYFIDRARQKKARALTAIILDRCADRARADMDALITKLMNCTAAQWANMASMASVNTPSMATCKMVFEMLRLHESFEQVKQRTWAVMFSETNLGRCPRRRGPEVCLNL